MMKAQVPRGTTATMPALVVGELRTLASVETITLSPNGKSPVPPGGDTGATIRNCAVAQPDPPLQRRKYQLPSDRSTGPSATAAVAPWASVETIDEPKPGALRMLRGRPSSVCTLTRSPGMMPPGRPVSSSSSAAATASRISGRSA